MLHFYLSAIRFFHICIHYNLYYILLLVSIWLAKVNDCTPSGRVDGFSDINLSIKSKPETISSTLGVDDVGAIIDSVTGIPSLESASSCEGKKRKE